MTLRLRLAACLGLPLLALAIGALIDSAPGYALPAARLPAAARPVAYGEILAGGQTYSGSGNFIVRWDGRNQWYAIRISGLVYDAAARVARLSAVTPEGETVCQTGSAGGEILARCYDGRGMPTRAEFSFAAF